MKKLLIAVIVAAAVPALAHGAHEKPVHEKSSATQKANERQNLNEGKVLRAMMIEKTKINEH